MDCRSSTNPEENQDLCITCYKCTYVYNSDGGEAAAACSNVNPGTDVRQVFEYYCTPETPDSGYDGIYRDFENLVCAPTQTKVRVFCAATSELTSDNDYWVYSLSRKLVVVREDADLGPPEFGGYYNVENVKEGEVCCNGDNCNEVDLNKPTPMNNERNEQLVCKTCAYSRSSDDDGKSPFYGDEKCLADIDNVDSGVCAEGQTCSFEVKESANNFAGNNPGLGRTTQILTRGCRSHSMSGGRPETMLKQRRTTICEGNLCNNAQQNIDPEDIGPLPRPGRWDQPIKEAEVALWCGSFGAECVSCYSCTAKYGDNFDVCRNKGDFNPLLTYRRRFYDERRGVWVNNVCAITTAFIVPNNGLGNGVGRGVVQLTDEEFAEMSQLPELYPPINLYDEEQQFCLGDLCNADSSSLPPSSVNRCHFCQSMSQGDACYLGIVDEGTTEVCPTGVCMTTTSSNGWIRRGCSLDESVNEEVNGWLEGTGETSVRLQVQGERFACFSDSCNDQYVNTENEISPVPPVYNPVEAPAPVTADACDNPNLFGPDTDLCIECYNCQHIVDDNSDDYETCITNPGEGAYYFKAEGGIPTVCALRTEKILTDTGYKYFVRRGAVHYLDPSLVNSIGPTTIETRRETELYCKDTGCNGYAIDKIPIPPIVGPKRSIRSTSKAAPFCWSCFYDETMEEENRGDPSCLTEPSKGEQCKDEEVCYLNLFEQYKVSDDPFMNTDIVMSRGCKNPNDQSAYNLGSRKIDTWVCRGAMCNSGTSESQPPPYDPLPSDPDRWSEPLSDSDLRICAWTDCKSCQTCEVVYAVDAEYPESYECDTRTYKSYYVNTADTSKLWYNQCSVRSGIRETGTEVAVRFVSHIVTQSETEEPTLDAQRLNAVTRLISSSARTTCPVCNGDECNSPTKICNAIQNVYNFFVFSIPNAAFYLL